MFNDLLKMYKDNEFSFNEYCKDCYDNEKSNYKGSTISNTLMPFVISDKVVNCKVCFVGKIAHGEEIGEGIESPYDDGVTLESFTNIQRHLYFKGKSQVFIMTRKIMKEVFEDIELGYKNTIITNMVKCNNGSIRDTCSSRMKDNCINKNGIIWKEIELFKPTKVIFYTNYDYDIYIDKYRPPNYFKHIDLHDKTNKIRIGNINMPYWDRMFYDKSNNNLISFLRVGHPQGKNAIDFVKNISEWIIKTTT
jgi:hypothetical protein